MQEITIELIEQLDVNNYVNWLLNHKQTKRPVLKERALRLMEGKPKTIANYKSAINNTINRISWKEPTDQEKLFFPIWRKSEFDLCLQSYEDEIASSPLPKKMIANKEGEKTLDFIRTMPIIPKLLFKLINGQVTDNYYELAILTGHLDYLQFLHKVKSDNSDTNNKTIEVKPVQKFEKIDYAMYYYYLIKAGERAAMGFMEGEAGKLSALKQIASEHGFSFKAFQLAFNKINNDYNQTWITGTAQNLTNFQTVIKMLSPYPKAQLIAKDDQEKAIKHGDKRGNPIT